MDPSQGPHPQRGKSWQSIGVGLGLLSLLLTGCTPQSTETEGTNLRLADSYPTTHPFAVHGVSHFIEQMEESGATIEYFPSGQMGSAQDLASLVGNNVIDVAPASPAYLEDELPLSSVSDLPDMTDDACVAANAMMDLMTEDGVLYEAEYEPRGLRPLWIAIIPGYEVMTADHKVSSPSDVNSLLLRSSGGAFDVTTNAIGASPVSMAAGDTYEAITRRTVDGTSMPFVSVPSYSLQDVVNYSTNGLNLGSVGIPYVISEESWQELSESEQETLMDVSDSTNQSLCAGVNTEREVGREVMVEADVEFEDIEGDKLAAWQEVLEQTRTKWARSLDNVGLEGSEVLSAYEEAVEKHEQATS